MSSFKLTPRAQRDFDEIWDYSKGKWGARRALTYLRQVRTAIALIAGYPDLGPLFEDSGRLSQTRRRLARHLLSPA